MKPGDLCKIQRDCQCYYDEYGVNPSTTVCLIKRDHLVIYLRDADNDEVSISCELGVRFIMSLNLKICDETR
jgi:hypothetical protein